MVEFLCTKWILKLFAYYIKSMSLIYNYYYHLVVLSIFIYLFLIFTLLIYFIVKLCKLK